MTDVNPETAYRLFRSVLNESIDNYGYCRHRGHLTDTTWFTGGDMIKLADMFNINGVFYNLDGNHWVYITDMDDIETTIYDPMKGVETIRTENIGSVWINMNSKLQKEFYRNTSTTNSLTLSGNGADSDNQKDYLINDYFPNNPVHDDAIYFLEKLGKIQYDGSNCGPMCIYAALVTDLMSDYVNHTGETPNIGSETTLDIITIDYLAKIYSCLARTYTPGLKLAVKYVMEEYGDWFAWDSLIEAKSILEEQKYNDLEISANSDNKKNRSYSIAFSEIDALKKDAFRNVSPDIEKDNVLSGTFAHLAYSCPHQIRKMMTLAENHCSDTEILNNLKTARGHASEVDFVQISRQSPKDAARFYKAMIALDIAIEQMGHIDSNSPEDDEIVTYGHSKRVPDDSLEIILRRSLSNQ